MLQATQHPPNVFTLVVYLVIFLASIDCPDSANLTNKNTYCITYYFCDASPLDLNLYMEAVFFLGSSSIYSIIK